MVEISHAAPLVEVLVLLGVELTVIIVFAVF